MELRHKRLHLLFLLAKYGWLIVVQQSVGSWRGDQQYHKLNLTLYLILFVMDSELYHFAEISNQKILINIWWGVA